MLITIRIIQWRPPTCQSSITVIAKYLNYCIHRQSPDRIKEYAILIRVYLDSDDIFFSPTNVCGNFDVTLNMCSQRAYDQKILALLAASDI